MATQELPPELDEDVFDLTEVINLEDDVLDLSIEDKVEDSSPAPAESSAPEAQAPAAPAAPTPPPPPKAAPANAMEAEDMDLDNLLNQLESGEDLKDENYGLPQQNAMPEEDLEDITAAINAKRESFEAGLAEEESTKAESVDAEEADLDDLLSGLDAPDVEDSPQAPSAPAPEQASEEELEDLDNLDFAPISERDDVGEGSGELNLDDLESLLDSEAPVAKPTSEDPFGDLDDFLDGFETETPSAPEAEAEAEAEAEEFEPIATDDLDDLGDFMEGLDEQIPVENHSQADIIDEDDNLDDLLGGFDAPAAQAPKKATNEDIDDFLSEFVTDEAPKAKKKKKEQSLDDFDMSLDFLDGMDFSGVTDEPRDNDDFDLIGLDALDEEMIPLDSLDEDPLEDNDEFAELVSNEEQNSADTIDVEFPDDLDDFINSTDAAIDPVVDDTILDIDTSEEAESIDFTSENEVLENTNAQEAIDESADISAYIEEFDILPAQEEEILTIEEEMPRPKQAAPMQANTVQAPTNTTQAPQNYVQAPSNAVQAPANVSFDNTNNQTQLNLLFAEFRLLGSEIAELKRKDRTQDIDILLPVVGKELSCKDVEENLSALRSKLMSFEKSLSSMQEDVQNVASELAVDAEGEERSSIDNFIMEMSESFDKFSNSLTLFDNKISEMEKANTEMETSMTVLRTKVEKNAAKIELLSTRLDNVDATFANLENIVANTAARIIREELAAMLEEDNTDSYQAPVANAFEGAAQPEEAMNLDDFPLDMPELDNMETEQEADMAGLDESLADVMEDMMPAVEDVMPASEEINLDEMLDAPIETIAEAPAVNEEIDPFEALSAESNASEVTANAAPEEFDMDALFDTEAK